MIIVQIAGGLGNQMFQYATGRALAEKRKTELKIDCWVMFNFYKLWPYELDKLKLKENFAEKNEVPYFNVPSKNIIFRTLKYVMRKNKITLKKYYFEEEFKFDPKLLEQPDGTYLHGAFQTEKYFKDIRHILLREFEFKKKLDKKNEAIAKQMSECNSVSVHFRKGDYVSNKKNLSIFENCSINYYKKSVEFIAKKVKEPIFYVFSDDIDWVKKNFEIKHKTVFVHNPGKDSYKDMILMSTCKHNIIANSSFGWWGAWLNKNPEKIVIAPKKWFVKTKAPDIIPEDWIKIDNTS